MQPCCRVFFGITWRVLLINALKSDLKNTKNVHVTFCRTLSPLNVTYLLFEWTLKCFLLYVPYCCKVSHLKFQIIRYVLIIFSCLELDISKNVLTDIPDTIKQCKQLAIFDASVNPLQKIPGKSSGANFINALRYELLLRK